MVDIIQRAITTLEKTLSFIEAYPAGPEEWAIKNSMLIECRNTINDLSKYKEISNNQPVEHPCYFQDEEVKGK